MEKTNTWTTVQGNEFSNFQNEDLEGFDGPNFDGNNKPLIFTSCLYYFIK